MESKVINIPPIIGSGLSVDIGSYSESIQSKVKACEEEKTKRLSLEIYKVANGYIINQGPYLYTGVNETLIAHDKDELIKAIVAQLEIITA